jgi:hypothetical protein
MHLQIRAQKQNGLAARLTRCSPTVMSLYYNSSRGGTRTPDPVINSHKAPDFSRFPVIAGIAPPTHSTISDKFGHGVRGTFTRDVIDRLIDALTVARQEAEARGLFTRRPTPTSIDEVVGGLKVAR